MAGSGDKFLAMGFYLLILILAITEVFSVEREPCCYSKTVGGITYTRVSSGAVPGTVVPEKCLNDCIYSREDQPGSRFCFARGEKEVRCLSTPTGFLIITGTSANVSETHTNSSVYWTPDGSQCALPDFPFEAMHPTLAHVKGRTLVCDNSAPPLHPLNSPCYSLSHHKGWESDVTTLHNRFVSTTAITSEGLLLVGGYWSQNTTELIPFDPSYPPRPSFNIELDRYAHCSIQVNESVFILIGGGGMGTGTNVFHPDVTEYSAIHTMEPAIRKLPDLYILRVQFACGIFSTGGKQKLIVVGGTTDMFTYKTNTEILDYPNGAAWQDAAPLPSAVMTPRGASLANTFYVLGSNGVVGKDGAPYGAITDAANFVSVFSWDANNENWSVAGKIANATIIQEIVAVPQKAVEGYCP